MKLDRRKIEAAAAELAQTDPRMARLIEVVGPCRLRPRGLGDPFGALARSIVYQQLSGKAAGTIHRRFVALFDDQRPTPAGVLSRSDEQLRGAGLSRNKLLAIQDLAAHFTDGRIPTPAKLRREDDETIVEHLVAVRGIGRWTVEMLLIFYMGRPDVISPTDLGIRKGVAVIDALPDLPTPQQVIERSEAWRPWRSVACWYLWRAADLGSI